MTITPLTAQGSGATATATESAGAVNAVTITAGGSGYLPGSTVNITFTGGAGTGAAAVAVVPATGILTTASVTITAGGSGYTSNPTGVVLVPAGGGPAQATTTGALVPTAGQSISGMTGQVTWCIEVLSLTAAKSVTASLELSTNAFSASVMADTKQFLGQQGAGGTTYVQGAYNPTTDKRSTVVRQQLPSSAANYFGVTSAVARVNITAIDSSALVVVNSWLES